jgi:hypothetical protein
LPDLGVVLVGLCVGAFTVAVLVVGTRLLWLARRTRQLPELLIGVAFLGCGLGYLGVIGARAPALGAHAHTVHMLGRTAYSVGCAAVAVVTWRVFRPGGIAPLLLVCGLFLGIGAGFVGDMLFEDLAFRVTTPLFWAGLAAAAATFGWAALESIRYYGMLRRQRRIGLADRGVARRILLWGLAAGAIFAVYPTVAWSVVATGDPNGEGQRLAASLCTLVASICIWAAFFPKPKQLVRAAARGARTA